MASSDIDSRIRPGRKAACSHPGYRGARHKGGFQYVTKVAVHTLAHTLAHMHIRYSSKNHQSLLKIIRVMGSEFASSHSSTVNTNILSHASPRMEGEASVMKIQVRLLTYLGSDDTKNFA